MTAQPSQAEGAFLEKLIGWCNQDSALAGQMRKIILSATNYLGSPVLPEESEYFCTSFFFRRVRENPRREPNIVYAVFCSYLLQSRNPPPAPEVLQTSFPNSPEDFAFAQLTSEINLEVKQKIPSLQANIPGDLFLSCTGILYRDIENRKDLLSFVRSCYSRLVQSGGNAIHSFYLNFLLYFIIVRGLTLKTILHNFHPKITELNIDPHEEIFLLYDFWQDKRYKPQELNTLFILLQNLWPLYYPKKKKHIAAITDLMKNFIRISRNKGTSYIKDILNLYRQHPYMDLSEWVTEGARQIIAYGEFNSRTRAYFRKESDISRRIWQKNDTAVYLKSIHRRLSYFIIAITGKTIPLYPSLDSQGNPQENTCYTDGKSIFLSWQFIYSPKKDENDQFARHMALHECGHIEGGSFKEDPERFDNVSFRIQRMYPGTYEKNRIVMKISIQKIRRALKRRGYNAEIIKDPIEECSHFTRLKYCFPYPTLIWDFFNITEDFRVDRIMYRKYSGFQKELPRINELFYKQIPALAKNRLENWFGAVIYTLLYGKFKETILPEHKTALEQIKGIQREYENQKNPDVYTAFLYAAEIYQSFVAHMNKSCPKELSRLDMEQTDLCSEALGIKIIIQDLPMEKIYQENRAKKFSGNTSAETQKIQNSYRDCPTTDCYNLDIDQLEFFSYPEWNHQDNRYRENYCRLIEVPRENQEQKDPSKTIVDLEDTEYMNELLGIPSWDKPQKKVTMESRYHGQIEALKRSILCLKPEKLRIQRGEEDGSEMDFDALIDSIMDFKAGRQMQENHYINYLRKDRSVLTSLVLDMSSSTKEKMGEETIFYYEKIAAYLFSEALNSIEDSFGIYSYFDQGWENVFFFPIKEFDEPYNRDIYHRIEKLEPARLSSKSRLGPGLRHIIEKMKAQSFKTKIIFLFTDGAPIYLEGKKDKGETSTHICDDGRMITLIEPVRVISTWNHRETYVMEDLKKVYEEALRAGIHIFCITLDEETVPLMKKSFAGQCIYLPRIEDLPSRLIGIYKKLTR